MTGVWTVIAIVLIALLLVGWIANSARLARKNKNLARRSPKVFGKGGPEVGEDNRTPH